MPLGAAHRLAPEALFLDPDPAADGAALKAALDRLAGFSPGVAAETDPALAGLWAGRGSARRPGAAVGAGAADRSAGSARRWRRSCPGRRWRGSAGRDSRPPWRLRSAARAAARPRARSGAHGPRGAATRRAGSPRVGGARPRRRRAGRGRGVSGATPRGHAEPRSGGACPPRSVRAARHRPGRGVAALRGRGPVRAGGGVAPCPGPGRGNGSVPAAPRPGADGDGTAR
jgi:hypothetical protein